MLFYKHNYKIILDQSREVKKIITGKSHTNNRVLYGKQEIKIILSQKLQVARTDDNLEKQIIILRYKGKL